MKWHVLLQLALMLASLASATNNYQDYNDNEFAEFEDFEPEEEVAAPNGNQQQHQHSLKDAKETPDETDVGGDDDFAIEDDQDMVIEADDDSEFEHFHDTEEFEGFSDGKDEKPFAEPKITITKVPIHFRANWDSYWLEILMVAGLVVYFVNFTTGKSKNTKIANAWFQTHRSLLEDNFSLVGDDGALEKSDNKGLMKESENIFTLWCSGRTCCEGMLVELKLIKRQDLVAVIGGMMRPTVDQVHIKVTMNKEDMDGFVFCVATKKSAAHLVKEMADLSVYAAERRPGERHGLPAAFNVMSEVSEVALSMLDTKVTAILNKYADMVDYIHFSDQYTGPKQTEENNGAMKLPDTQKVLLFGFNIKVKWMPLNEAMEQLKPLMVLVFYCIEKVKRYRLSKEGKAKADKNRQRVEEAFLKSTHAARAEAAAARKEERKRLEQEKIMAEEDPERQRRLEEREYKRQHKKKNPKMRQLKVKAI